MLARSRTCKCRTASTHFQDVFSLFPAAADVLDYASPGTQAPNQGWVTIELRVEDATMLDGILIEIATMIRQYQDEPPTGETDSLHKREGLEGEDSARARRRGGVGMGRGRRGEGDGRNEERRREEKRGGVGGKRENRPLSLPIHVPLLGVQDCLRQETSLRSPTSCRRLACGGWIGQLACSN